MAQPGAGSNLTAEQQAIVTLQAELAQTRTQVLRVSEAHDALKAAHDALNLAAQNALIEKEQKIRDTEDRLKALIFRQQFDLLDSKDLKPDAFRGRAQGSAAQGRGPRDGRSRERRYASGAPG